MTKWQYFHNPKNESQKKSNAYFEVIDFLSERNYEDQSHLKALESDYNYYLKKGSEEKKKSIPRQKPKVSYIKRRYINPQSSMQMSPFFRRML